MATVESVHHVDVPGYGRISIPVQIHYRPIEDVARDVLAEEEKRHLKRQRVSWWPRLVRWAKRKWARDVAGEGY